VWGGVSPPWLARRGSGEDGAEGAELGTFAVAGGVSALSAYSALSDFPLFAFAFVLLCVSASLR
jgi:hypothetical protein